MTQRSATQASFTVEQLIAATPAQVFQAYADPAAKAAWFGGPGEGTREAHFDFREGGSEVSVGGAPGEPVYGFRCRFYDIVPNERIVSAYEMDRDGTRISVSLVTTEFRPEAGGARVIHTEHVSFLDGQDNLESRQGGTAWLLGRLAETLEAGRVAA